MSCSTNNKSDVLILGAGPAGLSAGYKLVERNKTVTFVEKNDCVGGLARTLKYNDMLLDIGPHILCSKEYVYDYYPNIYALIRELLGDELDEYESNNKLYREVVAVGSKKYKYPVNISNALKNVGLKGSINIGYDYLCALKTKSSSNDYENSLVSSLGRSLSDLFLLNISKKTWGIPCAQMSADVAKRVGDFSVFDVLKKQCKNLVGAVAKKGNPVAYPKHGIGVICDRLKEEIDMSGNASWMMSSVPSQITIENNKIVSVTVAEKESSRYTEISPEEVISSIPLNDLLSIITPKPPRDVLLAASKLRARSHVCVYLVFEAKKIIEEHCIYFADLEIPFARMMEMNHYSDALVSEGKVVLGVEYLCWFGDECWSMEDSALSNKTIYWLKKLGIIAQEKLVDSFVHREKDAYPVYELEYAENLQKVKDYLSGITNLHIVGRIGSFNYYGQYKAMQMGIDVAELCLL